MLRRCVCRSLDVATWRAKIRVCDQGTASDSIRVTTLRFNGTERNIRYLIEVSHTVQKSGQFGDGIGNALDQLINLRRLPDGEHSLGSS